MILFLWGVEIKSWFLIFFVLIISFDFYLKINKNYNNKTKFCGFCLTKAIVCFV